MGEREPLGDDFASAAERSLHEHFEPVRATPPLPPSGLSESVNRTLRWQAILVLPVTAAFAIAGGALDAARAMFRSRPS